MSNRSTREQWLNRVARELAPTFKKLGYPLPPFRISTGFTSSGRRGAAVAECWTDKADPEGFHQIFLDPRDDDQVNVVNSVAHELIHCAVGLQHGHKGPFAEVATALGMLAPMTATPSGPEFIALAEKILAKVGPYPHKRLQVPFDGLLTAPTPAANPGDKPAKPKPAPVSTVITSGPKPQGTRMIKASCAGCGYTVRATRKWIDVAVPACPNPECESNGQPMQIG